MWTADVALTWLITFLFFSLSPLILLLLSKILYASLVAPQSSSPITFFFLSFYVLVEKGMIHLTSFIDRNPSLKAILSRLDLVGNANTHCFRSPDDPSPTTLRHCRRCLFLHLTCLRIINDDFFSDDDDDGRSLFWSHKKASVNGSFLAFGPFNLKSRFSDLVINNGIRIYEVVRYGITFKAEGLSFTDYKDNENEKEAENEKLDLGNGQEVVRAVDLQFFIKGLELGCRDAAALFLLVSMLSSHSSSPIQNPLCFSRCTPIFFSHHLLLLIFPCPH